MEFYTIGVFGSSEQEFFQKLVENRIDTFCDIRQHRGVRGATYAFVNNKHLQTKLKRLHIKYEHLVELASTKEIRAVQKEKDTEKGERNTDREKLSDAYIASYTNEILNKVNVNTFLEKLKENDVKRLKENNVKRVVLFCVEEKPAACHRSLIASKLSALGFPVKHL